MLFCVHRSVYMHNVYRYDFEYKPFPVEFSDHYDNMLRTCAFMLSEVSLAIQDLTSAMNDENSSVLQIVVWCEIFWLVFLEMPSRQRIKRNDVQNASKLETMF